MSNLTDFTKTSLDRLEFYGFHIVPGTQTLKKVMTLVSGNYVIDGGAQQADITLMEGNTYIFDVSDSSMSGHPLAFSTTSDGTRAGGTEYTTGVTVSGTAGQPGATVTFVVPSKIPSPNVGSAVDKLYYYCKDHDNMGGTAWTPEWKQDLQITVTGGSDNIDTRYKTKNQEDIFEDSFLARRGLTYRVENGNLLLDLDQNTTY